MIDDVVIDTNVFMHASDPRQEHQGACLRLIELMTQCQTDLCVDVGSNSLRPLEGFIMTEYLERLAPGTVGRELVTTLLAAARVVATSRAVPRAVAKRIEAVRNTRDRKFVAVAFNSNDQVLASQDFRDFSVSTRRRMRDLVRIVDARQCNDLL
jgi:predicted nucleic acid-binding protein